MCSLASLLSGIYPLPVMHALLVTILLIVYKTICMVTTFESSFPPFPNLEKIKDTLNKYTWLG